MIKLKTYSLGVKHHKPQSLYNIQSLPSYEVNIKICQPPRGCFPMGWKQPLEGWQLDIHLVWIMKAITVLLYRNYTKMFKTCLFWQKMKIKSNYGTGLNKISTHFRLSRVVDQATIYCRPLYYIYLGCPPGCLPH